MAIISNPENLFCENHFVFSEKNILVQKNALTSEDSKLTKDNLPAEETLRKCLENQAVSDWFAEPEKNYSAMLLEQDAPIPSDCTSIPLREFFWRAKDDSLKELSARAHGFLKLRETYIYCPKCGTKLEVDTKFTAKVCHSCGRLDFPRIEPAVIVLVSKGDEVLLAKSKTSASKYFSCIAGFVEHGETIEQTVAREVKEETNIEVKNIRYAGSQPWPFPDQLMLAFTAEYAGGEIKIQEEEIAEAAWFKRTELPQTPPPGSVAYNLIHGKF